MQLKAATDSFQAIAAGTRGYVCGVDFPSVGGSHLKAVQGAFVQKSCAVTISGGATAHEFAANNAVIRDVGNTTSFTNNATFSDAFISGSSNGSTNTSGATYTLNAHTVTGARFDANSGATLFTNGTCATLPGSVAGTQTTQGQCL